MLKKIFRVTFLLGVLGILSAISTWYVARYTVTQKANQKANELLSNTSIEGTSQTSDDQKIIAITKKVFKTFQHKDPSSIPAYKVRPYITNKRLPAFIRFPDGAMETNIQAGLCDNASRMLAFILEKEGHPSVQWNMVTDKGGTPHDL